MQEKVSFRLVVRRGPQPHQSYEITQDVTTLGRDITNDIVINDRETSRHHLRLLCSDDSVAVEDLGSTNGTFANGKRVSGVTPLQNGDMIGLGETVILGFEIHRASQPAPPPASDELTAQESVTPLPSAPAELPPAESAYAPAPVQPPQEYGYQTPAPTDPYAPPPGDSQPQPNYPVYGEQPTPAQQQAGYGIPAPPQYAGYDYDPYAVREEDGRSSRWLILGCFVFAVLACICFSIVGLVLIDTLNLWCDAPIVTQIVSALGYCG